MVGYTARSLFGTLGPMNEGNWQLQVCSIISQSARSDWRLECCLWKG